MCLEWRGEKGGSEEEKEGAQEEAEEGEEEEGEGQEEGARRKRGEREGSPWPQLDFARGRLP